MSKTIITKIILLLVILLLFVDCQKNLQREGYVNVDGGRISYKIVGDGDGIPLLFIHGGPGSRSCTMIPGYSLMSNERPLIFYDQLGSGNSDNPSDTTLWKLDRFVEEINYLRNDLNLKELHILGHSWGAAVLIEYLITKNPNGVKSVIFSSPYLGSKIWMEDTKIILKQLPQNLQDTIQKYELNKEYDAAPYLAAIDSFYSRFLSRNNWPMIPTLECENVPPFNSDVYNYMWGPTEFTVTGTLKSFDRTKELQRIEYPTLFIIGEFDELRLETIYKYQKMTKNSSVAIIEDSGHYTMVDQPERVTVVIREFLESIEN
jgi:proline iminopeptidase